MLNIGVSNGLRCYLNYARAFLMGQVTVFIPILIAFLLPLSAYKTMVSSITLGAPIALGRNELDICCFDFWE